MGETDYIHQFYENHDDECISGSHFKEPEKILSKLRSGFESFG